MAPRWLQAACLVLFAAYQVGGVVLAVYPHRRPGPVGVESLFGPVVWKMFAPYEPTNWRVDFEAPAGDGWVVLPMEAWVPRTADGGLLWEKAPVLAHPSFRLPFLRIACARSGAARVRAVFHSWPRRGATPPPRHKVLVTWTCGP